MSDRAVIAGDFPYRDIAGAATMISHHDIQIIVWIAYHDTYMEQFTDRGTNFDSATSARDDIASILTIKCGVFYCLAFYCFCRDIAITITVLCQRFVKERGLSVRNVAIDDSMIL